MPSHRSRGQCTLCGLEATRTGMAQHLGSCAQRKASMEQAAQASPGASEQLYHLQIQNAGSGDFWLQVEIRGTAMLYDLDRYLRVIWLECCDHLSRFNIGRRDGQEVGMHRLIDAVFAGVRELTHIYDFGSSSETSIRLIDRRQGAALSQQPLFLLARNHMPANTCTACGQPATRLCMECLETVCEQHMPTHMHEEEDEPIALVNSPRLGKCSYTGPAMPPY